MLTPQRVGLLSWAFAALLMGSVGLASYKFGGDDDAPRLGSTKIQAVSLPPTGGDVQTTASISGTMDKSGVEVFRTEFPDAERFTAADRTDIEGLQREIESLRRRLDSMTERNQAYAMRIGALEAELGRDAQNERKNEQARAPVILKPKRDGMPAPEPGPISAQTELLPPLAQPAPQPAAPPVIVRPQAAIVPIPTAKVAKAEPPAAMAIPQEPVRIVTLPSAGNEPVMTGSIDPASFDATPTPTVEPPAPIAPSDPAGRIQGGGESRIKRSDFGAVIGRFSTADAARDAWDAFTQQNEERMMDLRPLVRKIAPERDDVVLLVGPFANAADAAVACLRLLDVTELCHPALYAGEPLVAASILGSGPAF